MLLARREKAHVSFLSFHVYTFQSKTFATVFNEKKKKHPIFTPLRKIQRAQTKKSYLHDIPPFRSRIPNRSNFLHSPYARFRLHGRKCAREVRVEKASSFPKDLRGNLCGLKPWMNFQLVLWNNFSRFQTNKQRFYFGYSTQPTRSTFCLFCLCPSKSVLLGRILLPGRVTVAGSYQHASFLAQNKMSISWLSWRILSLKVTGKVRFLQLWAKHPVKDTKMRFYSEGRKVFGCG